MNDVYKNCNMCKKNTSHGCSIKTPSQCVAGNFSQFVRCEYPLFYCERCKTHSVKFNLNGSTSQNKVPRLVPWCFYCDDYPMVDGNLAIGKEYTELMFRERR